MKHFRNIIVISFCCLLLLTGPAFGIVATSTSRIQYNANGSTTAFAFSFGVGATSEVQVILTTSLAVETTLTETTNYTVSCTNNDCSAGGTVTTVSTYATGNTITILRTVPLTQASDFVEGQPTLYETFETGLDKLTRISQQQQEEINRAPKLAKSSTITNIALPAPTANNYLGWNAGATGLENKTAPVATTATQYEIDALISYGGGTAYTQATIESALTAIGTTDKKTLLLRPGTWVISSNANWSAYTNVEFLIPPGATISHGAFTVNVPNINANAYQIVNGTGVVTLSGFVREVYPEWFGAIADGTTDNATAFGRLNSSLNASNNKLARFTGNDYKTTDTITWYDGVQWVGNSRAISNTTQAALTYTYLTKITFAPTSEKDLFDLTNVAVGNSYMNGIYIGGFNIVGNTTGGVTFSRYAISNGAAQSTFENLGIHYFQDAIYSNEEMSNRYNNVYIANMSHAGLYTSTSTSTSNVYTNVIIRESPWAGILRRTINFRFIGCLFEELTIGGFQLYTNSTTTEFISCYAENVPTDTASADSMFKLGFDAGTEAVENMITIIGGRYTTTEVNGNPVFLNASHVFGAQIIAPYVYGYNKGIQATADTHDFGIHATGISWQSITTELSGTTGKLYGIQNNDELNAVDPSPIIRGAALNLTGGVTTTSMTFGNYAVSFSDGSGSPEAAVTAIPGSVYINKLGGAGTTLYIKESGTGNTGWVAK